MIQSIQNTVQVTPNSCISQLVILPLIEIGEFKNKERGSKGFGSSDIYRTQKLLLWQFWSFWHTALANFPGVTVIILQTN